MHLVIIIPCLNEEKTISNVIKAIPENCSGCMVCELVCTMEHFGVINRYKSGIRIERKSVTEDIPHVCSQGNECNYECIAACKYDALEKDENGVVRVIEEKCVGCRLCELACPLNAIHVHEKMAYKCDLCGGDPQCVKYCSQNALQLVEG